MIQQTMSTRNTFSRRSFATALALAPWVARAQRSPLRARIKIDTERIIGDIDPKIYGNFIEHLGRCIDGGVFDEDSPLSDANGFRKDVLDAAKDLNVSHAALAGRKLLVQLPLDGRHRSARQAAAAAGDGLGHGRKQSLRHA